MGHLLTRGRTEKSENENEDQHEHEHGRERGHGRARLRRGRERNGFLKGARSTIRSLAQPDSLHPIALHNAKGGKHLLVPLPKALEPRLPFLLGHSSVESTMIYLHLLDRPGAGAPGPLDLSPTGNSGASLAE